MIYHYLNLTYRPMTALYSVNLAIKIIQKKFVPTGAEYGYSTTIYKKMFGKKSP